MDEQDVEELIRKFSEEMLKLKPNEEKTGA